MKKCFLYILSIMQYWKEARTSRLIKELQLFAFRKKRNAHVMLSFACLTIELKDYWAKPLKQKSVQKLLKSKEWRRKESSIKLNRIYSLTINTYITTEKESKTRKMVYFSLFISWFLLLKTIEKQLWKLIYQSSNTFSSFYLLFSYS